MVPSVLEAVSSFVMMWYTLNTHSSADHPVFVYYIQGAMEPLVNSVFSTLPPTCIPPEHLQWLMGVAQQMFQKEESQEEKKEEELTRDWGLL